MRYRAVTLAVLTATAAAGPALARPAPVPAPATPAAAPLPRKPVYRIVSPAEGALVKAGDIPIVVEGVDGATIRRLRLTANGNRYSATVPEQPEARATVTWPAARAKGGAYALTVDVYTTQGNLVRLPLNLTLEPAPPPVVQAPPGLTPVQEKLWWARRAYPIRPEEAEQYTRQALEEAQKASDADGRATALSLLRQLGAIFLASSRRALREGNPADGRRYLDKALAIAQEGKETYSLFECYADDAILQVQEGSRAGALRRVAAMEELMGQVSHSPSRSQFQVLLRFATALNAVGRTEDAFRCLDRTLEMLDEVERARAIAGAAGTAATTKSMSAEWMAIYRDAYSAQDWIAWMRAYVDILKTQKPPPAARLKTVAAIHARVAEALAGLDADANALKQQDNSAAGATYLRLVQRAVEDAAALKVEIEELAKPAGGTLPNSGASNK